MQKSCLQQTRVHKVCPYYITLQDFPTVFDLAKADETNVLKFGKVLGYYSRARNLHYSAKYIANDLNGKFPQTTKKL